MLAYQTLKDTPRYERDRRYWLNKIPTFPLAPELPFLENPATAIQPRFERKLATIEKKVWRQFKEQAQRYDLSPTSVLLAVYGQVLARWSKTAHFLINLTLFNRFPLHPQVNSILGDFTILELFEFGATPSDANDNSLLSFLTHIQKNLWDDLDHRFFTGIHVLRELAQTRRIPPDNIAPVVFTCLLHLDTPVSASQPFLSAEESLGLAYETAQTSQVWVDNKVFELEGELVVEWDYLAALFPEGVIEAMHDAFCDLIRYLATENWEQQPFPDCLPPAVTDTVHAMNQTTTPDAPCLLDDGFYQSATRLPHNTAIIFRQQSISYAYLLAQVDQAVQRIQACTEYAAAEAIAVYMQKTVYQAIACLAILKLGRAYLPIHAEWPVERVKAILTSTPVRIVLTHQPVLATLDTRLLKDKIFIALDETNQSSAKKIAGQNAPARHPDDPAYIIYTSGSTGLPKGVRNSHSAASNTVQDINCRFQVTAQDTLLALADISFDLSVYDMFGLLGVGGAIVLPEQTLLKEPAHWLSLMTQHAVTVWNSVPALMQMLVDYVELLSVEEKAQYTFSLRLILLSGDVIPVPLPPRVQRIFPHAQIISVGGPTECSIWSVVYPIQLVKADWKRIPYGKPLSNQSIYVLNAAYQYTPFYVCGDIYIGGKGLAIDYWRDPGKTQEKFINHPHTGERLYKSGDLGSLLPSGEMMILGRDDFQIKKEGHRIELGEIEAHIRQFSFIQNAVVELCPYLTHQRALVAFVVRKKAAATSLLRYEQTNIRTRRLSAFELALTPPPGDKRFYYARKSYRDFDQKHNTRVTLSLLTQCLRLTESQIPPDFVDLNQLLLPFSTNGDVNLPKYRYPSAGGLYPVQVYVTVAEISDDVPVGHYYYHSYYHKLIQITAEKVIGNTGVTLHFVTHLPAIAPLYSDHALPFSQLEAGYMLGLLPGGEGQMDRDPQIHAALKLTPDDQYIASYPCTRTSRLAPQKDSLRLYLLYPDLQEGTLTAYRWCWQQQQLKDKQVFNGSLVAHVSMDHSMSILEEAACLLCFVGQATVENYLAIGSRAQRMMLSLLEQQIGACPLGTVNLSHALSNYLGGELLHTVACGAVSDRQIADTRPSLAKESDPGYLRHALRKVLPSVMLPDYFVDVDQIPLTLNGKVDRKALQALLSARTEEPRDYQEPSTPNEKIMAGIWQEVLKQEHVGLTDNFFNLGGNSLTAVQVISRINAVYQQNCMVRDIFVAPTIQALLTHLKLAKPPEMDSFIPMVEQQATALASNAQQRLWFLSHYDARQSLSYHIPMGYRIKGALDVNALEKSINLLIERHGSLRTSFKQEQHQVYQVVQPFRYQKLMIETITDEAALTQKIDDLLARNFNLETGPLFEVYLFRLVYSTEHLLWINQHHSISDGWSLTILRSELSDLYNSFHANQSPPLTPLKRSYIDYSHWQRETYLSSEKIAEQKRYWLKQLQTIPPLDLYIAKPRPPVQTFNGAVQRFEISPMLTAQLKQRCLAEDMTLFMLLLSAYALTLQRYSDVETVIIGTPVANRRHPDLEGMVGFFVNILPLCILLGDNPGLRRYWERVKNVCLDAFHHQDIPFAMLVESLQLERDISRTPVFQTTFVLQPRQEKTLELAGLEVADFKIKTGLAKFDLHLEIIESSSHGLSCALEFNTDIFAARIYNNLLNTTAIC